MSANLTATHNRPETAPSVELVHRLAVHTSVSHPVFHSSIQSSVYLFIPACIDLFIFVLSAKRFTISLIQSKLLCKLNQFCTTAHTFSDIFTFRCLALVSGQNEHLHWQRLHVLKTTSRFTATGTKSIPPHCNSVKKMRRGGEKILISLKIQNKTNEATLCNQLA